MEYFQSLTTVELLNLADHLDALFVEEDNQGSPYASLTMEVWEQVQEVIDMRLDTSV